MSRFFYQVAMQSIDNKKIEMVRCFVGFTVWSTSRNNDNETRNRTLANNKEDTNLMFSSLQEYRQIQ